MISALAALVLPLLAVPTPAEAQAAGGVLLEGLGRPLLLVHAVTGMAATFATTHHAVYAWLSARGPRRAGPLRRFGWIAPLLVSLQILLGLLLYPNYRVRVRAAHLDHEAPFVVQLFDFKEHLAALALVLVVGAALAGRQPPVADPAESGKVAWATAALSITAAALVWTAALIGLYVTSVHPVGLP